MYTGQVLSFQGAGNMSQGILMGNSEKQSHFEQGSMISPAAGGMSSS